MQKPDAIRAFVFDFAVGLGRPSAPVDPMSGMLLNLVDIDAVMGDLQSLCSSRVWTSWSELVDETQAFLAMRFAKRGITVDEICLREARGFWLRWRKGVLTMGRKEIRELGGVVWRLCWESAFDEGMVESAELVGAAPEAFDGVLERNPSLIFFEHENLANREKWRWER